MSSFDIDIIPQEDDSIIVRIYGGENEAWQDKFNQNSQIKAVFESYKTSTNKDFPRDLLDRIKPQKNKDVTNEEELLINYITGYEEKNFAVNPNEDGYIPEIIGKPFSNPFTIFTYICTTK